mgnify:CR=1 FL=1
MTADHPSKPTGDQPGSSPEQHESVLLDEPSTADLRAKVTEAVLTYVAVDDNRRPRATRTQRLDQRHHGIGRGADHRQFGGVGQRCHIPVDLQAVEREDAAGIGRPPQHRQAGVAGRGIAQLMNEGQIVTFDHSGFAFLGTGDFLGLPFPVVLVIITFALVQLLTRRTALGLYIEAVGANPSASHYMGLNAKAIKMSVYCVAGLCAALAGMIAAADIKGSDANNAGLWLELDAILAVVIGGASLMGGRFSIFLAVIGALIIQTLSVTIILSGIPPKFNLLIKASAIIIV